MTVLAVPSEHTVELRGLRFHYAEWGASASPPIVLLHGIGAMCRIWDYLATALGEQFHLFAPDQRGHGETSWPDAPAYRTDDYVGDLEALVQTWGLGRFALVGLSMGGMNAMAYAARHPDRLTHLVVVDIRPAVNPDKRPNRNLDKRTAEGGHQTFGTLHEAFVARKLTHPYTPDESIRHHVEHLCKPLPNGRFAFKHDPRVSYYWRPSNLWGELARIDVPVLIVRGGHSQVLPPEMAEQMRDAFPRAELVTIPGAGHTVPEDQPGAFNAEVAGFLARYPA